MSLKDINPFRNFYSSPVRASNCKFQDKGGSCYFILLPNKLFYAEYFKSFPERQLIGYNINNRQAQPTQIWSKNYADSQSHVQSGMLIIFTARKRSCEKVIFPHVPVCSHGDHVPQRRHQKLGIPFPLLLIFGGHHWIPFKIYLI